MPNSQSQVKRVKAKLEKISIEPKTTPKEKKWEKISEKMRLADILASQGLPSENGGPGPDDSAGTDAIAA